MGNKDDIGYKVTKLIRNFFIGQLLSFVISVTGVWTTYLVNNDASYPVLQSLTAYCAIFVVYMPLYIYFHTKNKTTKFSNFRFLQKPWKYAILAIIDLEANYLVIQAYEYTNIMSVQLFSCFTTPCVLVLSVIILHASFGLTHIFGSALAIGGLIFLIVIDSSTDDHGGKSQAIGDLLCMGSSLLYATSNVVTEWFIKPQKEDEAGPNESDSLEIQMISENRELIAEDLNGTEVECYETVPAVAGDEVSERVEISKELDEVPPYIPMFEYLAMMSIFAIIFSTIQFFAIEWRSFAPKRESWKHEDWVNQILFGFTMLCVYTLMPTLFLICSACFANLSLLTTNVYAIFWNSVVFHLPPTMWFIVTLFLISIGMIVFNLTDIVDVHWVQRIDRPWRKESEENEN